MRAKVKLSHPKKGLEYLLLVIKINTKGLLVNYLPKLRPDDRVLLDLRGPASKSGIKLKGAIHKSIQHPNGNRGTIVRFEKLNTKEKGVLNDFIKQLSAPIPNPKTPIAKEELVPSRDQTVVAPMESLSHLALESPDQKPNFVSSTFDEESIGEKKSQDLGGATMIAKASQFEAIPKVKQKKKRRLTRFILIFGGIAILSYLAVEGPKILKFMPGKGGSESVGEQIADELFDQEEEAKNTSKPKKPPKSSARKKPQKKPKKQTSQTRTKTSNLQIRRFNVQETDAFFKITIESNQGIRQPKIVRSESPRALHFDFTKTKLNMKKRSQSFKQRLLSKIRFTRTSSKTRMSVYFNSTRFPRYDIQKYPNFVDIFIFKN